jgi:hypothetical protein
MRRYEDYQEDKSKDDLTDEEWKNVEWVKYKIVVPTEEDKKELEEAFEHLHYSDIDTDNIPVNQLVHEYYTAERSGDPNTKNNIILDKELYNELSSEVEGDMNHVDSFNKLLIEVAESDAGYRRKLALLKKYIDVITKKDEL